MVPCGCWFKSLFYRSKNSEQHLQTRSAAGKFSSDTSCPDCASLSPNCWLFRHALSFPIPLELKSFKKPLPFIFFIYFFFFPPSYSHWGTESLQQHKQKTCHCHRLSFGSLLFFPVRFFFSVDDDKIYLVMCNYSS